MQLVMQKNGLPQDKAQAVVESVVTHLKGRLPEALTSQLNAFLGSSGEGDATAGFADKAKSVVAGLSSMFGQKNG